LQRFASLLATGEGLPVEDRFKILNFVENLTYGQTGVNIKGESFHGTGSPQAQRIMITLLSKLRRKKEVS